MEVTATINTQQFSDKAKNDYKLVVKAQEGDQKAFAKLLAKYRDAVFYMINRMVKNYDDAEDLTMESFGRAFKNITFYQPTNNFSTWLFRIASNNAIDFIRQNRQKTISIDKEPTEDSDNTEYIPILAEADGDPEENLITSQRQTMLRSIVEQLPDDYKSVVQKRYYEEKSYIEISKELLVPIGTVKARLYRSRELLTAIINNNNLEKDKI